MAALQARAAREGRNKEEAASALGRHSSMSAAHEKRLTLYLTSADEGTQPTTRSIASHPVSPSPSTFRDDSLALASARDELALTRPALEGAPASPSQAAGHSL